MLKSGDLCVVDIDTHCFINGIGLKQIKRKELVIVINGGTEHWVMNVFTKFGIAEINKKVLIPYNIGY
jgi:hypothetical protein